MSVKNFACFDLYPTTMLSDTVPGYLGGIANTPLKDFIVPFSNSGSTSSSIGVSSNPDHDFMVGGQRARSLVVHKSTTTNSNNYFRLGNGIGSTVLNHTDNVGKSFREVIGFAFKWRSLGAGSATVHILNAARYSGSSVSTGQNYSILAMNAGKMIVNGTTLDRDLNEDQEYYVEAVLSSTLTSGSGNVCTIELWIDGELINSRDYTIGSTTTAASNFVYYQWRLGPSESTTRVFQMMFAHFYHLSKGFNESPTAPFDNRLGPQKVRLATVKNVTENDGWTTEGAADPVTAWGLDNFGNDEAYVQSPEDDGPLSVQLQLPTNASSKIHGIQFLARTQREGLVARPLNYSFADQGGTVLGTGTHAPQGGNPLNVGLLMVAGSQTPDTDKLTHANLSNAIFTLRAPVQ